MGGPIDFQENSLVNEFDLGNHIKVRSNLWQKKNP